MSKKKEKIDNKTKISTLIPVTSILFVGLIYQYVSILVNSRPLGANEADNEWLYVFWASIFASIISVVGIYNAKKLWKIIPIVCLIVLILIAISAQFRHSFSSYQF